MYPQRAQFSLFPSRGHWRHFSLFSSRHPRIQFSDVQVPHNHPFWNKRTAVFAASRCRQCITSYDKPARDTLRLTSVTSHLTIAFRSRLDQEINLLYCPRAQLLVIPIALRSLDASYFVRDYTPLYSQVFSVLSPIARGKVHHLHERRRRHAFSIPGRRADTSHHPVPALEEG